DFHVTGVPDVCSSDLFRRCLCQSGGWSCAPHFLYFCVSPTDQLSTMARITESMGRLSVTAVCRAELPAAMSTTSSGPAPTASAEDRKSVVQGRREWRC